MIIPYVRSQELKALVRNERNDVAKFIKELRKTDMPKARLFVKRLRLAEKAIMQNMLIDIMSDHG